MKVLAIFGTRPEAIKMAPVVRALKATPGVAVRVCVTGQHRSMLDSVLETFAITPDDDLDVMSANQGLSEVFARILVGLDPILASWRPDFLLVQGDTATCTAGALAGYFRQVRVGHVEAGLRTGNMASPFPEEGNRRIAAVVTDRHYAPTERARRALLAEGYRDETIRVVGNTVIDALLHTTALLGQDGPLKRAVETEFDWIDPGRRLILVTGHRRESFGQGFAGICDALAEIGRRRDVQVVYPVHLNPNVRGPVFDRLSNVDNVHLIEPLDYPRFVWLMSRAHLILTDSGGIQEEAPALKKPVLVMRDTTERPEGLAAGTARLVGADADRIAAEASRLLDDQAAYAAMARAHNPFGDGRAAPRIAALIAAAHGVST